jgi:hypothetical protein
MRPTDRPEFLRTLNGVAAIKGKDLTPEALNVWWGAMAAWSIEDFKAAASHLVSACQFMPSPYDFAQLRKAGESTGGEAWVEVLSGRALVPGSRAARAAQIVGGQQAIRHADIETALPHIQRRFLTAYEELSDVDVVREALPQIAGPVDDSRRLGGGFAKIGVAS